MELSFEQAELWQLQEAINELESLGKADRLLVTFPFKFWIVCALFEEVFEGGVEIFEGLL